MSCLRRGEVHRGGNRTALGGTRGGGTVPTHAAKGRGTNHLGTIVMLSNGYSAIPRFRGRSHERGVEARARYPEAGWDRSADRAWADPLGTPQIRRAGLMPSRTRPPCQRKLPRSLRRGEAISTHGDQARGLGDRLTRRGEAIIVAETMIPCREMIPCRDDDAL
jgi:hypothetical protein